MDIASPRSAFDPKRPYGRWGSPPSGVLNTIDLRIRDIHLAWPQPASLLAAHAAMLSRGEPTMRTAGKRTVTVVPTPTSLCRSRYGSCQARRRWWSMLAALGGPWSTPCELPGSNPLRCRSPLASGRGALRAWSTCRSGNLCGAGDGVRERAAQDRHGPTACWRGSRKERLGHQGREPISRLGR